MTDAEAQREGWLGETEGLRISLAGAESKISQIDPKSPGGPVNIGLPARKEGPMMGRQKRPQPFLLDSHEIPALHAGGRPTPHTPCRSETEVKLLISFVVHG